MRRFGRCHCRPVPLAAGRRQIKSERGYSSMEAAIARSHIKLWWGDLVISNRASRHPEEQNGEVSAFMIGDTCFAWWSNEQLRWLAERRQQEKEAQKAEWSRVKGGSANSTRPPARTWRALQNAFHTGPFARGVVTAWGPA